jgi:hypothetical protein
MCRILKWKERINKYVKKGEKTKGQKERIKGTNNN